MLFFFTQTGDSLDVVHYGARGKIIYIPKENKVILIDTAWVHYKELEVKSDSIEYNTKTRVLDAIKKTLLSSVKENITGSGLSYNIDTKKGMMSSGETKIEKGTFKGKEIWMVNENTLNVNRGYYTTCDQDPPHYYFYAPRMKVFLNDMVITQPVILYIHDLPVMAAPFWFFPISKNRKSGLMPFKFGNSKTEGRYAKNLSYYWVINDYADMTFALDIMERKGFMPKMEGVYLVRPFIAGSFLGSYIRESDTRMQRWSFLLNHKSMLPFGATLDAKADFQSDRSYDPQYTQDKIVWLKKESRSFAAVTKSFPFMTANLIFEQYTNYDADSATVKFPSLSLSFFGRPLFPTQGEPRWFNTIYWSGSLAGVNSRSAWRDSTPPAIPHDTASTLRSVGGNTGLSATHKIFGALNIGEAITYTHTIFPGVTTPPQITYGFNASANFTLYRVYGLFLLGMHGLLHQVTPHINYSYAPDVRLVGNFGLPQFSSLGKANTLGFGLSNLFQAKLGGEKEKKDILVVNLGSGYNLLEPAKPISPIGVDVDFPSLTKIRTRIGASYDIYQKEYSYNVSSSADLSSLIGIPISDSTGTEPKGLTLRFGHYYSKDANNLTFQLGLNLTRNWNVSLNSGYDLKNKKMVDYNLAVTRDLHCWQGIFSVSGLGSRWVYDFKIQIKDIPDIQIGKGLWGFLP
jgi:lipopolysaccharide assembly outer membrane protein LptD (OstA)